jgi:hypothetical protein
LSIFESWTLAAECLTAKAKDWHRLRRFRLRGLEKVNAEVLLIAAGQNIKRLLTCAGRLLTHTGSVAGCIVRDALGVQRGFFNRLILLFGG